MTPKLEKLEELMLTSFSSFSSFGVIARLKRWLRQRYTKLRINLTAASDVAADEEPDEVKELELLDVHEYAHYTNIGRDMTSVMQSIADSIGVRFGRVLQF